MAMRSRSSCCPWRRAERRVTVSAAVSQFRGSSSFCIPRALVGAQEPFSIYAARRPLRPWAVRSCSRFSMVTNTPPL